MDHHVTHSHPNTQTASSASTSETSGQGPQISLDDDEARISDMRWTHTRPLSNVLSLSNMPFIDMFNRTTSSAFSNRASSSSSKEKEKHVQTKRKDKHSLPVLRWFNTHEQHWTRSKSQPSSPVDSSAHLPMSTQTHAASTPTTPVSTPAALLDALQDDPVLTSPLRHTGSFSASGSAGSDPESLPSRPAKAKLPHSFRPSAPPSYLSSLTRSTLPTACLSPSQPYTNKYSDPFQDPYASADLDLLYSPTPDPTAIPHSPAPVHLPQAFASSTSGFSPGSSLDSLKSIHERGRTVHDRSRHLHSSQLNFPGLPDSFRNWFNPEEGQQGGKDTIRPLLNEEDKAADSEDQKEHIRQKCQFAFSCPRVIVGVPMLSEGVRLWS